MIVNLSPFVKKKKTSYLRKILQFYMNKGILYPNRETTLFITYQQKWQNPCPKSGPKTKPKKEEGLVCA
jgi:hypothetical protein